MKNQKSMICYLNIIHNAQFYWIFVDDISNYIIFHWYYRREAIVKKTNARPVSQYATEIKFKNAHTQKENFGFVENGNVATVDNKTLTNGGNQSATSWYKEVVELRKQAELYKVCINILYDGNNASLMTHDT